MIPVDMPLMVLGYMIYMYSEVFLWLFVAGLIAMLIPRSRRYILARRWKLGILMVLLAAGSAPYVQVTFELWQYWRAHHPRLDVQQMVGDLVLPVGTQVDLAILKPFDDLSGDPIPYGLQSIRRADFDRTPGIIKGLQVRSLELWDGSATVETLTANDLEGWHCEPGKVEYIFPSGARFKFSEWRLSNCMLAPGTQLGGIVWPGPVRVFSTAPDWEARSENVPVMGMELRWMSMRLNRPYGEARAWSGTSNHAFDFGPVHYPADTLVRRNEERMQFSLPLGVQARDQRTGAPIEGGQTVIQSMAGDVLEARSNQSMGIYFPDELIVR